ncbi:hypothetical protein [Streptococcus cuniculi]|uniref:DUF1310 family protein n=1 Tax=Streptococcus cuniculi TaxID=1432788 RepID=A0A4Y9JAC3_9STRE|nr:hypothetical protein [Streptococcus cuniculi]MBF0778253.1 hypothetical protein [Streptococcus cuniculi]TFU97990.1 hypothetical protein E4T82_05885 [Streptococcus cuniculi]
MKKKVLILLFILGGIIMAFSINGQVQKSAEEKRNREYEVSLVKALKNSYRDIEEIQVLDTVYYKEPGNWGCVLQILFSDGRTAKYNLGHGLNDEINKSAVAHPDTLAVLSKHYGSTEGKVQVIYSNGDQGVQ